MGRVGVKENMNMKIVIVNHVTYDNEYKEKDYYFYTSDNVKKGNIVLCDTKYGAALGRVKNVIENISISDLFYSNFGLNLCALFRKNISIRKCKLLPNYERIKLHSVNDLPF